MKKQNLLLKKLAKNKVVIYQIKPVIGNKVKKSVVDYIKKDYEIILTSRNQKQLQHASNLLNVESAPSDVSNFFSIDEALMTSQNNIKIFSKNKPLLAALNNK